MHSSSLALSLSQSDLGSGEFASIDPIRPDDVIFENMLYAGAIKFGSDGWEDVAAHMIHYLGATGTPFRVDPNEMREEMGEFRRKSDVYELTCGVQLGNK